VFLSKPPWLAGDSWSLRDGIIVLVNVLVHDLTFTYTSSCTGNVYRCAVNGYDLPASRAKVGRVSQQTAVADEWLMELA
jgi:hypothetical protein